MKKLIQYLIFTVLFVLFGSISALAAENLSVNVQPENNKIRVSWNELGYQYKLYKIEGETEESLYEGNDNEFVVTGLEEGKFYKFKLLAIKDNKEYDQVIINTSTTDSMEKENRIQSFSTTTKVDEGLDSEIYYPMKGAQINAFVGNDNITVEWDNLPNDFKYFEVYKNDTLIARTQKLQYIDNDIVKDEVYRYKIVGYKKLPEEKILEIKEELKEKEIKYGLKDHTDLFYERKNLTAVVRASEGNVMPKVSENESNLKTTEELKTTSEYSTKSFTPPSGTGYLLRYTTFIPLDYAPNPWCDVVCSTYHYFGGDGKNRGFDFWSNRFRTRSDVYVTWNGSSKYAKLNPQIGLTTGYDKNYNFVDSDRAPSSDIHIQNVEYGSDYIYHRMGLASNNPLTPSPDIDAFYYAKVFKNGNGEFYGVHDKAPSHEFYIAVYPGDFYAPIHTHTHSGFDYLWPWTTKEEFEINFY